jgi:hypothetical protein
MRIAATLAEVPNRALPTDDTGQTASAGHSLVAMSGASGCFMPTVW